jgi:hypothetical protein
MRLLAAFTMGVLLATNFSLQIAYGESTAHPKHHELDEKPIRPLSKIDFDFLPIVPPDPNRPEGQRYIVTKDPKHDKDFIYTPNPIFDPRAVRHSSRLAPATPGVTFEKEADIIRGITRPIQTDRRGGKDFEPKDLFEAEFDALSWNTIRPLCNARPAVEIAIIKYDKARARGVDPDTSRTIAREIILEGSRFEQAKKAGVPLPDFKDRETIFKEHLLKIVAGTAKNTSSLASNGVIALGGTATSGGVAKIAIEILAEGVAEYYDIEKEYQGQDRNPSGGERFERALQNTGNGLSDKKNSEWLDQAHRIASVTSGYSLNKKHFFRIRNRDAESFVFMNEIAVDEGAMGFPNESTLESIEEFNPNHKPSKANLKLYAPFKKINGSPRARAKRAGQPLDLQLDGAALQPFKLQLSPIFSEMRSELKPNVEMAPNEETDVKVTDIQDLGPGEPETKLQDEDFAKRYQNVLDFHDSASRLFRATAGLSGNADFRQGMMTMATVFDISKGVTQVGYLVNKWDSLDSLNQLTGATDAIGLCLNLVSLAMGSGPSPDEIILQELRALAKQLREGIDRLDKKLDLIQGDLQARMNEVLYLIENVGKGVDTVDARLRLLDEKLHAMESRLQITLQEMKKQMQEVIAVDYRNFKAQAAETRRLHPDLQLNTTDFFSALNQYKSWANHSTLSLNSELLKGKTRSQQLAVIKEIPPVEALKHVVTVDDSFGILAPEAVRTASVPSFTYWNQVVTDTLEFLAAHPVHDDKDISAEFDAISELGQQLIDALGYGNKAQAYGMLGAREVQTANMLLLKLQGVRRSFVSRYLLGGIPGEDTAKWLSGAPSLRIDISTVYNYPYIDLKPPIELQGHPAVDKQKLWLVMPPALRLLGWVREVLGKPKIVVSAKVSKVSWHKIYTPGPVREFTCYTPAFSLALSSPDYTGSISSDEIRAPHAQRCKSNGFIDAVDRNSRTKQFGFYQEDRLTAEDEEIWSRELNVTEIFVAKGTEWKPNESAPKAHLSAFDWLQTEVSTVEETYAARPWEVKWGNRAEIAQQGTELLQLTFKHPPQEITTAKLGSNPLIKIDDLEELSRISQDIKETSEWLANRMKIFHPRIAARFKKNYIMCLVLESQLGPIQGGKCPLLAQKEESKDQEPKEDPNAFYNVSDLMQARYELFLKEIHRALRDEPRSPSVAAIEQVQATLKAEIQNRIRRVEVRKTAARLLQN